MNSSPLSPYAHDRSGLVWAYRFNQAHQGEVVSIAELDEVTLQAQS